MPSGRVDGAHAGGGDRDPGEVASRDAHLSEIAISTSLPCACMRTHMRRATRTYVHSTVRCTGGSKGLVVGCFIDLCWARERSALRLWQSKSASALVWPFGPNCAPLVSRPRRFIPCISDLDSSSRESTESPTELRRNLARISTKWYPMLGIGAFVSCSLVGCLSHGSWRGRRLGGCADAETAVEVGAWCAPAHTADRRGPGADEPCVCSQVEAIMAMIVSNEEGSPRSRPRSPGVCKPARTCGETSNPPL